MGIKSIVKKVGTKVGNKVAQLAELSPLQVEEIQNARDNYLLEMPNLNDYAAEELTNRMLSAVGIEIYNAYLPQIKELYLPIMKDAEYDIPFDPMHNIRYVNITKWVTDSKENSLEKLVNVYAVLANEDCNIALVFNRTKSETKVYLAVVNTRNETNNVNVNIYKDRLVEAIKGNFPGATLENSDGIGIIPCLNNDKAYSVATASNIPTEKSEKFISQTIEKLLDGIIPDSKAKEYTIVLLATPIKDVEERKLRLGAMYSGLAPYASWQTDYHFTDLESFGSSATIGVNVGASAGVQNGTNNAVTDSKSNTDSQSQTNTESESQTDTKGNSETDSESSAHSEGSNESTTDTVGEGGSSSQSRQVTHGTNETTGRNSSNSYGTSETKTEGVSANVTVSSNTTIQAGGGILPGGVSEQIGISSQTGMSTSTAKATNESHTYGSSYTSGTTDSTSLGVTEATNWVKNKAKSVGMTVADTLTKGKASTISNSVSKMTGSSVANTFGKAVTNALSNTKGIVKNTNLGLNFGASFARSSTVTATVGKSEGITQSFTNFNIKHALELLESQMKRYEQSTALGMWDFAAYVLSEDQSVANNVAHSYLALTQGEESYMSKSAINTWRGNVENERMVSSVIASYIRELRHPLFCLNPYLLEGEHSFIEYPAVVTSTTCLSGKELAYSLNFPQKSVAGLPVLECAEFGRNVVKYDLSNTEDKSFNLGKVFHMNHIERALVDLSLESLKSHTFITGSTGSGKSNTIYQILNKIYDNGVKFMVIEPAKGEYKNVFGVDAKYNVSVYGTNPKLTPLLRINPFSFPDEIHILEHMDRLVELFNVCWPMYAAMPAVLKSAIEKSYTDCGWDLVSSNNLYGCSIFPTFNDVAENIRIIIDTSEYDSENKGAYKGSLLTRLQSLTTGVNRLLFSTEDIPDEELFEKNVIVDLSRIGSTETKALIMGILVMKLQEYRIASCTYMNSQLRHITVLEEAHNILRRTSSEQSQEGANLLGKSVEMLANSIAEMRTYGEGFIIADQAPGLMDMSVIRNTNTKIIMRLPDQTDRELVGRAAGLNDEQIKEIAKLSRGVAAVYQNEWVQPVLCKVDRFNYEESPYTFNKKDNKNIIEMDNDISNSLLNCIMDKELFKIGDKRDLRELKDRIIRSRLDTKIKVDICEYLNASNEEGVTKLRCLIYDFLNADKAIEASEKIDDIHEWVENVLRELKPSITEYSNREIDLVIALIIYEHSERNEQYKSKLCEFTDEFRKGDAFL